MYQAYRYNLLFVYDSDVDTKGLIYPRALQQVLTGIYLAEVCMIGLFAIRAAIGPLIMMALYTVVTILAHISLNDALNPLLNALPRTLDTAGDDDEDEAEPSTAVQSPEEHRCKDENCICPAISSTRTATATTANSEPSPTHPPGHLPFARQRTRLSSLADWALPRSIYTDYTTLRRKMRTDTATSLDESTAEDAYYPPAVTSPVPLLWVPRDPGGVSAQEVEVTREVIPITDAEAHLDERNKVVWDKVGMKPPIWREKIFY